MTRANWIRSLSLTAVAIVIGWGGAAIPAVAADASKPAAAPAAPATPAAMGNATITGKVMFEGPVPPTPKIKMDADPVCLSQHGDAIHAQNLVVNNKGVRYAFIFVVNGLPGGQTYAAPKTPAIFDQVGCLYEPHVLGVQVGQPVEIRNSDGTLHNVNAKPAQSAAFNLAMPTKGMKISKSFTAPEIMVPVKCNVHPWMQAYIGVIAHPFFAVSGADGSFSIKGLPAGTYMIEVWHESLGTQTQTVTVADGESAAANFTFGKAA